MDMRIVEIGGAYRHYKGSLYIVAGFATDTDDENAMKILVLYHPYDNPEVLWTKSITKWLEPTEQGYERFKRETQYDRVN